MGIFGRKTYASPGQHSAEQVPEGYYSNRPKACCAIREADDRHTGYPQWVEKALAKSGGHFYACPACWAAIMQQIA